MIGYSSTILRYTQKRSKRLDIPIGTRYGCYTVIGPTFHPRFPDLKKPKSSKYALKVLSVVVECDCGQVRCVPAKNLAGKTTRDCNCNEKIARYLHNECKTRLYKLWIGMKGRCSNMPKENKNYNIYKGKGIKVCVDWLWFSPFKQWAFKNGYKDPEPGANRLDSLSLDRIDSSKDYCPENCRWVTLRENINNVTAERDRKITQLKTELKQIQDNMNKDIRRDFMEFDEI